MVFNNNYMRDLKSINDFNGIFKNHYCVILNPIVFLFHINEMTFMMGIKFFLSMGNTFYIDVNISKLQLFSVCMDLHEWKTLM